LQFIQGDVAEFVQGALRIKGDIICKHFQPENIIKNSLIHLTPDKDLAPQAVQLLKNDWERHYRVVIYADTLSIPDYNAERAGRTEFISAMGQYISQIVPLVQMEPGAAPFLFQILQWGIASFRSAQSIEGVFQKALTEMTKKLAQPKQEPPDPKLMAANAKIQQDAAKAQQAMQLQAQKAQDSKEIEVIQAQADVATQQAKSNAEITKLVTEAVQAAMAHRQTLQEQEVTHKQQVIQNQVTHEQKQAHAEDAHALKLRQQAAALKAQPKKAKK
jgi:hypothetical protein